MLSLTHESTSPLIRTEAEFLEDNETCPITGVRTPGPPPKKAFSLHVAPAHPVETNFRHGYWHKKRKKVRDQLEAVGINRFALDRFDQCGGECIVEYSAEAGRHRLKANYCHCRHCEPCMKAKGNKIAGNLRRRLETEPKGDYRFITLTLKHSDTPLTEQIARLYASFKVLRANKIWSETQHGGAAILEVKWSDPKVFYRPKKGKPHWGDGLWHPHLHIIAEGLFLHKKELTKAWQAATGDSYIVDIRALSSEKDAAHYLSKYFSKGTSATVWDNPDIAQEWITAIKGVRTCLTFGTWRGYKLTTTPALYTDWTPVSSLLGLAQRISQGDEGALMLYLHLEGYKLDDEADVRNGRTTPK